MECGNDYIDYTVLITPKPTATSTVHRKKPEDKEKVESERLHRPDLEYSSFGLIPEELVTNVTDYDLNHERKRASDVLKRSSTRHSGLPSRYLKPSTSRSTAMESHFNITSESTISESDLLSTPRNASTPRNSISDSSNQLNQQRESFGQVMSKLSSMLSDKRMSIDDLFSKFKIMSQPNEHIKDSINSDMFIPGDQAASKLLADEMSWRQKNEIPADTSKQFSQLTESEKISRVSVGEFFRQKSDTISDIASAKSPRRSRKPIALIDSTVDFDAKDVDNSENSQSHTQHSVIEIGEERTDSLNISDIAKLISASHTPGKILNFLMNQPSKPKNSLKESELPVSSDSSYTSDYSENGALKDIIGKENVDTSNVQQSYSSRSASTLPEFKMSLQLDKLQQSLKNVALSEVRSQTSTERSSSCLTSLPGGKLPIQCTKTEIVWGCVKLNRCVTHEFTLRNKCDKRMLLQYTITNHSFSVRKDSHLDADSSLSNKLFLLPCESKKLAVVFAPTKIGPACGEILFNSADPSLPQTKKQSIKLYGYGGHGNIVLEKVTVDDSGKRWFSLGTLDNRGVLKRSFMILNSGTLPVFVYFIYESSMMSHFTSVVISYHSLVLSPKEKREISVCFTPTADDHRYIQSFPYNQGVNVGAIKVIWGTEVNRARLRKICMKAEQNNVKVDPTCNLFMEKIKEETPPTDISLYKESYGAIKDILQMFIRLNIVLTIEYDSDQTLISQYQDESAMFQTLTECTMTGHETIVLKDYFKLEPSTVILTPPTKIEDALLLISESTTPVSYHVSSSPAGLEIDVSEGRISPGDTVVLKVKVAKEATERSVYKIQVHVEDEILEASVKVIYLVAKSKLR